MGKYVPRPGPDKHRVVRRSAIVKDVARGRLRSVVRRHSSLVIARRTGGAAAAAVSRVGSLAAAILHIGRSALRVRTAIVAILLAAIIGGGTWAWRSSYFEIKSVEVVGTITLEPSELATLTNLDGRHMITADLDRAQREVLDVPLVRAVSIERKWPDRIVVHINERTPWGTWEQAGVRYAIDRDGVVLGNFSVPPGSPLVISADPISLRQGDRVSYQAVDAVVEIYELLPQELGTGVHQVAFVPGLGVEVVTDTGQVALLGDSSSVAYKLAVWAEVDAEARAQRINYGVIDLRWGNRPVLY